MQINLKRIFQRAEGHLLKIRLKVTMKLRASICLLKSAGEITCVDSGALFQNLWNGGIELSEEGTSKHLYQLEGNILRLSWTMFVQRIAECMKKIDKIYQ